VTHATGYPSVVNERFIMDPSPIPRWDTPKLHQSEHLTLLSAGREKRLYAVPPYTNVKPLEFDDVPFRVEEQEDWVCQKSGAKHKFMNELPQSDGSSKHELSDSDYLQKVVQGLTLGKAYYNDNGKFYRDDVFRTEATS
jgi:alpha-D-ribose 1-methylphosphonate 5-phosphate C-P lyase